MKSRPKIRGGERRSWLTGIAWAIVLMGFMGCGQRGNSGLQPSGKDIPDQEGWNSVVQVTKNGKPTAVIRYGHMEKFTKKNLLLLDQGLEVDFYNTEGQHTSNLVAKQGKMIENSGNVEAFKNVVVVSDSGITLKTEHLLWDAHKEKIISDQFVTITTPEGDTLFGQGFESDQSLQNWIIKNPRGISNKKVNISEIEAPGEAAPDTAAIKHRPVQKNKSQQPLPDSTVLDEQKRNDPFRKVEFKR